MKKKIFLIAITILLILTAGLFYVNKVLMPVQVRGFLEKTARTAFKRNVTIGSVQFNVLQGLVVRGLTVFSYDKPEEIFFSAQEASARLLFLPLFKKNVAISSVVLKKPFIRLRRFDETHWNFSDLVARQASPGDNKKTPFTMLINGIAVSDGKVMIEDISAAEPFRTEITPLNLAGSLSLNAVAEISGDLALSGTASSLRFELTTDLKNSSFKARLRPKNLSLHPWLRFTGKLPVQIHALDISEGDLSGSYEKDLLALSGDAVVPLVEMNIGNDKSVKARLAVSHFTISARPQALSFRGGVTAENVLLLLAQGFSFRGAIKSETIDLAMNDGRVTGQADLNITKADIGLGRNVNLKSDISIPSVTITPYPDGHKVAADIAVNDMAFQPGKGQAVKGTAGIKKLTALVRGENIFLKTDLQFSGAASFPGGALSSSITAPGAILLWEQGKLHAAARLTGKKTSATINKSVTFSGDPAVTISAGIDPASKTPLSLAGILRLKDARLSGIPQVEKAEGISGRILFGSDTAKTTGLRLTVMNTPFSVAGKIEHFAAPVADLTVRADAFDLASARLLAPALFKEQGITLSGTSSLQARVNGPLSQPGALKIEAGADITNAAVESSTLKQSLQNISGTLLYAPPSLLWKKLKLSHQGKAYTFDGYIKDFSAPFVAASLTGDNLQADIELKKNNNDISVRRFKAAWFNSAIDTQGLLRLPDDKAGTPYVEMKGELKLPLRDLPQFLPEAQARQVKDLLLAGILRISGTIKGRPADYKSLESDLTVTSPVVSLKGYELEDLTLKAAQKNGSLAPLTLRGNFYGGKLKVEASADLKGKDLPFTASVSLQDTSIALLKKATPLKNEQLTGSLNINGDLKGRVIDIRNMEGAAKVNITGGYLWDGNILARILSILSASFQGGDIVITDASASLDLSKGYIKTQDLVLKSKGISLLGDGWLDWDQNMDFNITPRLDTVAGAVPETGILGEVNPTAGLLNIRVYGTLSKPKFEHNLSAPQVIKKTLENTVGGLLKLFE
jgi:hypothetical protein